MKLFRRKDALLVGGLLALAGLALLATTLVRGAVKPSGFVEIYVDGALIQTVPLGSGDIAIRQENGDENHVFVTENGAYMAASTCRNQLCVQQGQVTTENYASRHLGASIICLPNRVVVTLATQAGGQPSPAPEDLPDI